MGAIDLGHPRSNDMFLSEGEGWPGGDNEQALISKKEVSREKECGKPAGGKYQLVVEQEIRLSVENATEMGHRDFKRGQGLKAAFKEINVLTVKDGW